MKRFLQLTVLTAALLLGSAASQVFGQQNYYWTGKGNNNRWNNRDNWSLSSNGSAAANIPGTTDNVIFDANSFNTSTTVTINVDVTCNNWTWNSTVAATLAMQGNNTLQVNGNFEMNANTATSFAAIATTFAGAGTHTLRSNIPFAGVVTVNKPGGTLTLGSAITFTNNITLSAGTLNANGNEITVEGAWSTNAGIFQHGEGTVRFQGTTASALTTSSTNIFNNLIISKTNSNVSLSTPINIAGNLTISNGSLVTNGQNINLSGNWASTNTGTFTHGSNTVTLTGSTPATISLTTGSAFHNLVINKPDATVNLASAVTINNNLTITNGSLIANSAANNITISGNWTSSSTGTFTHGGNTVTFAGANASTVATTSFFNRVVINKTNSLTLSTPVTVEENLTITSGSLLDNGNQITGNSIGALTLSNTTTLSLGSATAATTFPEFASYTLVSGSTVIYNSGVSQSLRSLSYGNLTLTNAATSGIVEKTLGGPVTVAGNLTINERNILRDAGHQITGNSTGTMTMVSGTQLFLTAAGSPMPQFNNYTLTGSTVTFDGASQNIRGMASYGNLVVAANTTQTLAGNITVANNLTINGSLAAGTNNITLAGNWTSSNGTFDAGTGTVTFNGTSTITTNSSFNHVSISGTATLTNSIFVTGNWASSGTFSAGTSTVTFEGGNAAASITSNANSPFHNLVINKGTSLQSAIVVNNDLTIAGALSAASSTSGITLFGNWIMGTNGSFVPNGNTVTFTGNSSMNLPSAAFHSVAIEKNNAVVTLTQPLTLAGNLAVTSGTLNANSQPVSVTGNITVSGGTLNASNSNITLAGNWSMTSGTFTNTGSTVTMQGGSNATISSTGAFTFNNLVINKTVGLSTAFSVNRNLTIAGTLSDNGNQISGTTAGTLTMSNGSILSLGSTGAATTFPTNFATSLDAGSTVIYNSGVAQTVRGGISYGNLTIAGSNTKTLGSDVVINGDLIIQSGTTLASSNRNIDLQGHWTSNGTFTAGTGRVTFSGSRNTNLTTNTNSNFSNITISKTSASNTVTQLTPATLTGNARFIMGDIVNTQSNLLIFSSTASTQDASNSSHVNGFVRKDGTTAFVYPIGNGTCFRPIGISAPGTSTDITAKYYDENPLITWSSATLDPNQSSGVGSVTAYEYWSLDKNGGSANVKVQLYYNVSCNTNIPSNYMGDPAGLIVASLSFNGSASNPGPGQWISRGGADNQVSQTIDAIQAMSDGLNRFTFGTRPTFNALPIDLLYFRATAVENTVQLDWATAAEINNDYFTIERSADGRNFSVLTTVNGKGNSKEPSKYSAADYAPSHGVTYYRLKQTDLDGKFTYSKTVAVQLNSIANALQAYGSGSKTLHINYRVGAEEQGVLSIYDSRGVQVWSKMVNGSAAQMQEEVHIPSAAIGMYMISLQMPSGTLVKKVMMF